MPEDSPYDYAAFQNTLDITLPAGMEVVPFGEPSANLLRENADGTETWRIEDMNFYMIVYAGDYVMEKIEAGGFEIEFYYARKHASIMEGANAADAVKYVVDYCTEKFGELTFLSDGKLKLIQRRVSGAGYAGYGASTMDELDFTAQNLSNSEKGGEAGEVVIHELVHQWWGLSNMFDEDESGLWTAEGLTVYTTYRIVKKLYGEAYARANYVDQWQQTVDEYYKNFYVRNPEYIGALPSSYAASIANSLSGVRMYSEMPLMILKAEALVGGEEAMDEILRGLFNRELDYTYPYLTYQEFLDACGLTEEDLRLE